MEAREPTRVPSLSRRHSPRPRLTRLLDESNSQAILLIGPAGYGKTSLACEWLAGRDDVAWYRATSASADLAAFSVGIAEALAPIAPRAAERLRQRLLVAEPPEKAARPLAEMLAEDLTNWPENAILVIDDYHLVVDSAPVEAFTDWLLAAAPTIRILITSRQRPAWATARRMLYGDVTELSHDYLAMTNEEAARLLSENPSLDVQELVSRAEGWPALIGLAALSSSQRIPAEQVARDLFRYMAEEVLEREEVEIQQFMLLASTPDSVDETVLQAFVSHVEARRLLDHLVSRGLLHEGPSSVFAFHLLLRDFLRIKFETDQPEEALSVSANVLATLIAAHRWEDAFNLALRHGWLDRATDIVALSSSHFLAKGRVETLERWLDVCGSNALMHHGAVIAKAELAMRRGRLPQAAALVDIAVDVLPDGSPETSRVYHVAGQIAHFRSDEESALRFHRTARDTAHSAVQRERAIWGMVAAAAELESSEAGLLLDELHASGTSDVEWRLKIAYGRTLIERASGSLAGAWTRVSPLVSIVDLAQDPMIKSSFLSWASFLACLSTEYAESARLARRADSICAEYRLRLTQILCQLILAAALVGSRNTLAARNVMRSVSSSDLASSDPYVQASLSALQLRLAFAEGNGQLVAYPTLSPTLRLPAALRAELDSLTALAAAARGDLTAAHDLAEHARTGSQAAEVQHLARYAHLLIQLIAGDSDPQPQALVDLVPETVATGVADSYVTAYRAYPPLLRSAEGIPELERLTVTALVASHDEHLAEVAGVRFLASGSPVAATAALTKRELEIFYLLAEGLSNREIATRLVIAESTVKVHIHNILKKLGVKTRLQAALIALQLLRDTPQG